MRSLSPEITLCTLMKLSLNKEIFKDKLKYTIFRDKFFQRLKNTFLTMSDGHNDTFQRCDCVPPKYWLNLPGNYTVWTSRKPTEYVPIANFRGTIYGILRRKEEAKKRRFDQLSRGHKSSDGVDSEEGSVDDLSWTMKRLFSTGDWLLLRRLS